MNVHVLRARAHLLASIPRCIPGFVQARRGNIHSLPSVALSDQSVPVACGSCEFRLLFAGVRQPDLEAVGGAT